MHKKKPSAKDIVVKPIATQLARRFIQKNHYSGKFVANSSLNFGVYLFDRLEGVMQFGSPMVKEKVHGLVEGTTWNGMLELNRMAFTERLPRNSESRAIGIAMRLIRQHYPHIKWVLSYSDATQCGDGTIYRASGFVLTNIGKNTSIWMFPDGEAVASITVTKPDGISKRRELCKKHGVPFYSGSSMQPFREIGAYPIEGYMLRYIYFVDKSWRSRLTVPEIPFSEIDRQGVGMYKGEARV